MKGRYIQIKKERLIEIITELTENPAEAAILLSRFCTYDKRKRLNYVQNEEIILS